LSVITYTLFCSLKIINGIRKKNKQSQGYSSRSDGGDAGSVVTTSSPVPKVKVKSMAIMMIQGQVEGTPVD
jgi:hypothetical protein